MANKAGWDCVDSLCRHVSHRFNLPFGGKILIGSGDFRQVAPVVLGCGEMATLAASVKTSPLWSQMHVYSLRSAIQTMLDPEFTEFINDVGEDYMKRPNLTILSIGVPVVKCEAPSDEQ